MYAITRRDTRILVEFDSYEAMEYLMSDDACHRAYMADLFSYMIGMTMPITVQIRTKISTELMLPEARAEADKLGQSHGTLIMQSTMSHRELDGHRLSREFLPMLMQPGIPKEVAREMANDH